VIFSTVAVDVHPSASAGRQAGMVPIEFWESLLLLSLNLEFALAVSILSLVTGLICSGQWLRTTLPLPPPP
jgi:hypothetical protein